MHTWPPTSAHVTDTQTDISLAGVSERLTAASIDDARAKTRQRLAAWAKHFGRPLTARLTDPTGTWTITVDPSADIQDAASPVRKSWWKK